MVDVSSPAVLGSTHLHGATELIAVVDCVSCCQRSQQHGSGWHKLIRKPAVGVDIVSATLCMVGEGFLVVTSSP